MKKIAFAALAVLGIALGAVNFALRLRATLSEPAIKSTVPTRPSFRIASVSNGN
jgi:hypothetical protein